MATLVFDIETIGEDWAALDATTQAVLTRWIDHTAKDEAEHAALLADIKSGLGFSPLTGSIVAIGVYDLERAQGVVYYTGPTELVNDETDDVFTYKVRSEKEMLSDFWAGAKSYDTFVTFNGRGFDVPYLMHRAAINGITPTRDLMRGRYLYQQRDVTHIDLMDQLSFYGAVRRPGNLHLYCRAYGIESPKANGVAGDDVAELFHQKKFRDIVRYNARDVIATAKLYEVWRQYFSRNEQSIDF